MSNYEIELQVQGSPSGELTQQVDGEPGGGSVSAREAEAWARGTRAGTAVSSDDPTYHNNSKYYAEQAHDAAESASAAYGTNLLAPTFDASQAYPAGAHVIHEGGYYVLPEGHTAGDTWAETSKTQQTVGGEVTGLKSTITSNPFITNSFTAVASTGHSSSKDRIYIAPNNIKTGEKYWLYIKQSGTRTYRIYTGYDDGTEGSSSYRTNTIEKLEQTALKGIAYIGIEVTSSGSESDFYFLVAKNPYGKSLVDIIDKDVPELQEDMEFWNGLITVKPNLFNPNDPDVLEGKILSRYDGVTEIENSSLGQTGFITVTPGQNYVANISNNYVIWYKSDKSYNGYTDTATHEAAGYATAPSNSAYGRWIYLLADVGVWQIEKGTTRTAYTSYGYSVLKNVTIKGNTEESHFVELNGVAFGTSLTYRAETTGGYLQYLPKLSGIMFDNQGVGNSQILYGSGYPDMLSKIKSYTGYSGKSVCIIEGFVNDWFRNHGSLGQYTDNAETSVCGCVRSAINYIMSQNANIRIFLILDPYGRNAGGIDNSSTAKNESNITQFEYYNEIAKVAESLGIPVISEYKISGISENTPQYFLNNDNIHPNALGAEQSAKTIWSQMKNYYPNCVSD